MRITIETIPHSEQRYPTPGDWFFDPADGHLVIRVSEMGDWRYEMLVAIHEAVEALMCHHDGITQETVDDFDKQFEAEREEGKHGPADEPGDATGAPYRRQHGIASGVERILGAELGVDWNDYADVVESL